MCIRDSYKVEKTSHFLPLPLDARKLKGFQLQGGFAPLTPRTGALPLDPAGGSAPDPRYRLAPARHDPCVPVPFSLRLEPCEEDTAFIVQSGILTFLIIIDGEIC